MAKPEKITFRKLTWNGRITRTVTVEENKDGYWRKRTQNELMAAFEAMGMVEVEDANQ